MSDFHNELEPILLIDRNKKKQAHVVIHVESTFEELIHSARKINDGMFEGDWDLCYINPETEKPEVVGKDQLIAPFVVGKDIDTFFWDFFAEHRRRTKRRQQAEGRATRYGRSRARTGTRSRAEAAGAGHAETAEARQSAEAGEIIPADLGKRMIAFLMDMMAIAIIARFVGRPDAFFWVAWLYYALMESSGLQATLGKRFMGLKVEDLYGRPLSFGRASGRYFGKMLSSMFMGLGWVLPFLTTNRQALHDLISKSVVVEDETSGYGER